MKKIAIFASGSGVATERVVSLFNEGNRIRVELVVTDRENSEIIERLKPLGIDVIYIPREQWHETPEQLLSQLADKEIELIALDDFRGVVPAVIEESFSGKTVNLTTPEEAPREVVSALNRIETDEMDKTGYEEQPVTESSENVEVAVDDKADDEAEGVSQESVEHEASGEEAKTVDEEWAETLKIDFDPSRLRSTPPPVPGGQPQAPKIPHQQTSQDTFSGNQNINPQNINTQYQNRQNSGYKSYEHAIQPETQEPMPSTYLIWSVLATVFCCFIPGIVAIVFASQVSSRYFSGDIEGSKRASERAQIWIIVSFVLGLLSSTLYLPIMMMG